MTLIALFSFLILIFSIVIHEVAHGIAALWQGDSTAKHAGRLTLNPISHIDLIGSVVVPLICLLFPGGLIIGWAKPVPVNPYNFRNRRFGEAFVAFAGPLSNLILALIAGLYIRFMGAETAVYIIELLQATVIINIVLAVFNLTPLPPLDGSKILYSLFPEKMGRFIGYFERYGLLLTILFVFLFIEVLNPVIFFLYKLMTGL